MRCLDIATWPGHIESFAPERDHQDLSGDIVPNIRSAKKDMRKSRAAAIRNRSQRSTLRTALKKSLATGVSADERTNAVSLLDRAARKGLIHPNKAARHKSQIAKVTA